MPERANGRAQGCETKRGNLAFKNSCGSCREEWVLSTRDLANSSALDQLTRLTTQEARAV